MGIEGVVRRIDRFGRITIPAEWRRWLGDKVVLLRTGQEEIVIRPFKSARPLSTFFDLVEVDASPEEFADPHKLRRALLRKQR